MCECGLRVWSVCLGSACMCQLLTANVTFASTPHIPLQINTPSHLTRLTPSSHRPLALLLCALCAAFCFHCYALFTSSTTIATTTTTTTTTSDLASSAQAQHLTSMFIFVAYEKVVPLIIICHCIRMCAAIEIQLCDLSKSL